MDFLPQWSGQGTDALIALEATHRIDSIVLAFEQALQQKAESASLSEAERDILIVEALEREVNNGGYRQFFISTAAEHVGIAVAALTRIGCPATADITARAIAELGDVAASGPDAIAVWLLRDDEARDRRLSACDAAYYASGEDIAGQLFAYIKRNHSAIQLP